MILEIYTENNNGINLPKMNNKYWKRP